MKFYLIFMMAHILTLCYGQSTEWTEPKLKHYWEQNGYDGIEGIYEQFSDPYLILGLVKEDTVYSLVYLKTILPKLSYEEWKEGDLKATLHPSENQNEFYCTWIKRTKRSYNYYFVKIDDIHLKLSRGSNRKGIITQFKKVYPEAP